MMHSNDPNELNSYKNQIHNNVYSDNYMCYHQNIRTNSHTLIMKFSIHIRYQERANNSNEW